MFNPLRLCGLWLTRLLSPWVSPGKNTEVGCHSLLLQGIFLTQGSNLGLLYCRQILYCLWHQGIPSANARDLRDTGLIPGLGRFPGGGHDNLLHYSCLGNPMDRGVWQAAVHRVAKSQTRLSSWAHTDFWSKYSSVIKRCLWYFVTAALVNSYHWEQKKPAEKIHSG